MKLTERRRAKTSSIYLVNNRKRIFTAVFPFYTRMSTLDTYIPTYIPHFNTSENLTNHNYKFPSERKDVMLDKDNQDKHVQQ